jgi:hypothetical protein
MAMTLSKSERFARFGIATKGLTYCLLGMLILGAVLGWGGRKAGLSEMLDFLAAGYVGKVILLLIASGLSGYVFWRLFQTFMDREGMGYDLKGIMNRSSYFSSALFYGVLAFAAVKALFYTGSGSQKALRETVQILLEKPQGQLLVAGLAAIFLGNSIFQFYVALSGIYRTKIKVGGLSDKNEKRLLKLGFLGFMARGITIGTVAYLLARAAYRANSSDTGGTEDAFEFLQNVFGSWALVVIAIGLFAYGAFLLVKSFYRKIYID